jgi:hypothetical protein
LASIGGPASQLLACALADGLSRNQMVLEHDGNFACHTEDIMCIRVAPAQGYVQRERCYEAPFTDEPSKPREVSPLSEAVQ